MTTSLLRLHTGLCLLATLASVSCGMPAGPVARYDFSEGHGRTAKDSNGNGVDGTIHGGRWWAYAGRPVLQFDGVNDFVDCGKSIVAQLASQVTVEAWVATRTQGRFSKIVTQGGPSTSPFWLSQGPASAKTYFGLRNADGVVSNAVCDRHLPVGGWVHLVGTYDGQQVRLFWNGKEVASRPQRGGIWRNDAALSVGKYTGGGECFDGLVGQIAIYARALPASEIGDAYELNKPRFSPPLDLAPRPVFSVPEPVKRGACVDLGARVEPFVDDWLISRMADVELRLQHPVRKNVALRFDRPWEGLFAGYGTVLKDRGLYRMYYRGQATMRSPPVTCYAESKDGIHWSKPDLGLVKYRDPSRPDLAPTTRNNIVWRGCYSFNFSPFLDTNPGCKPDERFKALASVVPWMTEASWLKAMGENTLSTGTCAFCSQDGVRWRLLAEDVMQPFDAQTPAFWDRVRGEYRAYCSRYRIHTSVSRDFRNWSRLHELRYADSSPERPYYASSMTSYFRAPHLHVGLPSRYVKSHPFLDQSSPFAQMGGKIAKIGVHDLVLMASRDGLSFTRWPEAFWRPGPDLHNWTGHSIFAMVGVVPTGRALPDGTPGEASLYITQHYSLPSAHVVRATIRTDGFASVHASHGAGEFTTRPFTFSGERLILNFSTSAAGSIRVEIQDDAGRPRPGFRLSDCRDIFGDELNRTVEWERGADLSQLAGLPIRLRFVMRDADLFSLRFQ